MQDAGRGSFWSRVLVIDGWSAEFKLSIIAVVVGALSAYAALAFRLATDAVSLLLYGVPEEEMPLAAASMTAGTLLAITTIGGLGLGLMCRFFLPGPLPQGVADVMEASALRNARMPWRQGLSAAWLSICSIGIGGSTGREGPIVHLGASLAAQVAKHLHLGPSLARTLLGCGVAGGIAAAFNAPIAGVFFALEVVIGHYGVGAFAPVVIASLIGTIVTRVHLGVDAVFGVGAQQVTSFLEVPAFLLLGFATAIVAIAMMRGVAVVRRFHEKLGVPDWLQPAVGGLALGTIALAEPAVLGIGYEATGQAIRNDTTLLPLVTLGLAKAAATAICLGSRFGGGIFSPSLALGAIVGAAFGLVAAAIFPELGSRASVYAVIGMASLAASTLGAPISTTIMIFELTTDYGVTFALIAAVAVASMTTRTLFGQSFFHWQLAERGVSLDDQRELGVLRDQHVRSVMHVDHITVAEDATFDEIKQQFRQHHAPIFVVDAERKLVGTIEFQDLADAACADPAEAPSNAAAMARRQRTALVPEDDLATAFTKCRSLQMEHIAVVRSLASMKVVGEVRQTDLIRAYNEALLRARAIEHGQA